MDSLEAVQKSHQERLDYVSRDRDQARKIAFFERHRAATAEDRAATAEDRANSAYLDHLKHCAKPIVITCDEVNYLKRIAELEKQVKDLKNQVAAQAKLYFAHDNKLAAIKKLLDTCFGDNIIFGLASAIRTILNGGN